MDRNLVEQVIREAQEQESNLVVSDRRDTFTVEKDDVSNIEVEDGYLKVGMQDGRATVYLMLDEVYKLVVERENARRSAGRTGFGAALD